VGVVLTLVLLGPVRAPAAGPPPVAVTLTPASPRPGDVVLLRATGVPADGEASWGDRPVPLFPLGAARAALVGLDLDTRPGPVAWRLVRRRAGGGAVVLARGVVTVRPRSFATQHLTLPPGQVDLDAETLARVQAEQTALRAALADWTGERLWHGPFRVPVEEGRPTGGFGLRRVLNNQPRSPHAGFDWAAPAGTPVAAVNAGRVALVAEHFFAGRLVVLDHGLGLFSLYFHLEETRVGPGQRVTGGQVVGTVGATGRATGPHLHLGVVLGGARVDPESLLGLRPPGEISP
jgi:murein DD-endopeptidase MepM/ murein hydrolase activator NlpD